MTTTTMTSMMTPMMTPMTITRTIVVVVFYLAAFNGNDVIGQKTTNSQASVYHEKTEVNRKLIVTTHLQPPYMLLRQQGNFLAGNERFEGFLADILSRLATSVGFRYEIRLSRDFGRLPDGMLQEVQRGEADLAAGAIILPNTAMHPAVGFTEPFLSFRVSALIRRSPSGPRGETTTAAHIITNALQVLGSDLTYGVIQNGIVQQILTNSTDPVIRALWTRITNFWPSGLVSSVQEGVERARRERYAFLVETPTAEYVASRRPCDLYASEPFLDVMRYAFVMRSDDFRLRDLISRELRRMKQTDELQTIYLRWWKDECAGAAQFASARRSQSSPETEIRRRRPAASATSSAARTAVAAVYLSMRGFHGDIFLAAVTVFFRVFVLD